ncbi:6-phosphogluconolactonase [Corynebacterium bovis]|uniref:6-phosphogluconolactonase n=1 Tax=Corynebacterium bovis TaxID=36808 RepID=UPI002448727D|nr:6-phosphogluconolactonase [Corynebacterium bovis]MDH2454995.1 6-phosphogluconolactonase [Corynebacterium bovis]
MTGSHTDHSDGPGTVDVVRARDVDDLALRAARDAVHLIAQAQTGGGVGGDGRARIVLTGGGAGIAVLRELAVLDHAATAQADSFPVTAVDWSRVDVFFGDERYVPADHPERNDGQADRALFDHVAVPPENIHRYAAPAPGDDPAGDGLDEAAAAYATVVTTHAPDGFDLHLLGMGPEGHVNSLFPDRAELDSTETVVPVRDCPKPPPERVSLTLDAVGRADAVWLLVAGEAKREAAGHALSGDDPTAWPAAGARGRRSTVLYVDAAADPTR